MVNSVERFGHYTLADGPVRGQVDFRHYTAAPVELAVDLVNDYASEPRTAEGSQDQPLPPLAAFLDAHDVPHTGVGEDDLEAVVRLADSANTAARIESSPDRMRISEPRDQE